MIFKIVTLKCKKKKKGCVENRVKAGIDRWDVKRTGKAFAKWLKGC